MNPMDPEDMLHQMMEKIRKREKIAEEVEEKTDELAEQAEREVLMKLWATLGNSHHNYFVILQTAGAFVDALKNVRKLSGLPDDLYGVAMEALVECIKLDLNCLAIVTKIKAEHGVEE